MRNSWTLSLITLVTAALGVTAAGVTPATANGTPVQIWSCNGGSNQKWTTLTAG